MAKAISMPGFMLRLGRSRLDNINFICLLPKEIAYGASIIDALLSKMNQPAFISITLKIVLFARRTRCAVKVYSVVTISSPIVFMKFGAVAVLYLTSPARIIPPVMSEEGHVLVLIHVENYEKDQ